MIPGIMSVGGFSETPTAGAGDDVWPHPDAFAGINFILGSALIEGTPISDLTTILGGDFDEAYLVAGGYDMTIGDPGVRGLGVMLATGDLLTRLQAMDWAVRIDVDVADPFQDSTWLRLINSSGDGAEHYFGGGGTYSTDFNGDYNPADIVNMPGTGGSAVRNKIATSNNASGWEESVNGAPTVTSGPQTTSTPDYIALGGDVDDTGTINFYNGTYGIIRRIEFFPLQLTAAIQALATI